MPTTVVVTQFAAMYSQGGTIAIPRVPEVATTNIDTAATTSLELQDNTAFVLVQAVSGQGARRVSGKAAIGAGNVGILVEDGQYVPLNVVPSTTLYFA